MTVELNGKMDEFVSDKQRTYGNFFRKLKRKGYNDDFLLTYKDDVALENIVLSLYPNSEKNITMICYMLGAYAKYLYEQGCLPDNSIYNKILNIDRKLLWDKAKPNAATKFLSHQKYLDLIKEVGYEDLNATYYVALIRCIYEGIYSEDLSVLSNLRGSDINKEKKYITVNNSNGDRYNINIPSDLIVELEELSDSHEWERLNRYREYFIRIYGKHSDSCFKVENRNQEESDDSDYARAYRNRLRKALDEFGGLKSVRPKTIFVSGIMYRIRLKLEEQNISISDALSPHNRNHIVTQTIQDELDYCNYKISVGLFREMVNGAADVFEK